MLSSSFSGPRKMSDFPPEVERFAKAFANNHLEHVGGADADTLVAGTPNWHFFTRDAETAVRITQEPGMGKDDQDLRKWCVEQAMSWPRSGVGSVADPIEGAQKLYSWVKGESSNEAPLRDDAASRS